ncbi:unnamed protein product [Prunus armeniaca]|uniref:Uncharacterized protein n=1 Tax=Prunus armeniaca TaxID=36596 RepID=A0A6J5TGB0_PRUAR|nr:unnamed protein product [Prunus armeniaca]CAB4293467.1 unnamed protein product [Prunus armeniaca]
MALVVKVLALVVVMMAMRFGEVKAVYMQNVEKPRFARLVFHSASAVEAVFNGRKKVVFSINEKDVTARKTLPTYA